ncbi:MAG: HD domain-containing protein, partial [Candidatus Gracilibacteria bacterium]
MAKPLKNITIEELIEKANKFVPEVDEKLIREAYEFAKESHEGQFKYENFPYVLHPLNATYLMIDLKPDMEAVLACLVHDTHLHNKEAMDFIKKKFGVEVYSLVNDARKLDLINAKTYEGQLETLRRMFLAMAKDLRVVFIKLSDRLHNMMTLEYMEPEVRLVIAQETHDIYAPIASRLGIYQFKSKLEDLAFKNLYPTEYKSLAKEVGKYGKEQQHDIDYAILELEKILKKEGFDAKINGRVKHVYSIYNKLKKKGLTDLSSIYDIYALRVVLDDKEDERGRDDFSHLYSILGIVHKNWTPLPKRFKDYIAVPKVNGYRSLHTSVIGLVKNNNNPVEVQIRTKSMHEEAEYGIAAHWWYKESSKKKGSKSADREEFQKTLNQYRVFTKLNHLLSGDPEVRYKVEKLIKDWDFLSKDEVAEIEGILTSRGFDSADMEVLRKSRSKGVIMMRHKYFQNQLEWLDGLAQLKSQADKDVTERNLKLDIFKDRIFVLTPHGDVKDLPAGATPVDFAYNVHTDVGNRCAQAKVDGKIVPLDYELKNGQVVEILTRAEPKPNRYWLSFVKTSVAANKVKGWFANFDKDQNIKEGRDLLNKYLKRVGKVISEKEFS